MRGSDRLAFERRFSRRKIDSTNSTAVDRNSLSQIFEHRRDEGRVAQISEARSATPPRRMRFSFSTAQPDRHMPTSGPANISIRTMVRPLSLMNLGARARLIAQPEWLGIADVPDGLPTSNRP
jgi:hypothetical protein